MIMPALFALGLPMNITVGTSIAQTAGIRIISTIRYRKFGNVNVKLWIVLVVRAIPGVETGVWALQQFKRFGQVDLVVSITYISIVGLLSAHILKEAYGARKIIFPVNMSALAGIVGKEAA